MKSTEYRDVTRGRSTSRAERLVTGYFEQAGIAVDGSHAWDPTIKDARLFERILNQGSLGLGESYMDEWWECRDLPEFFRRLIAWRTERGNKLHVLLPRLALEIRRRLFNLQTCARARHVIDTHYDLSQTLFELMLGSSMAYSCAYWNSAADLDEAQRNKLDLICRKLELKTSDRVLDLGCGFGSFSRHAAENYGCEVVAVTLSDSQADFARRYCAGLPIDIRVCDYREVERYADGRRFDKIANIAMVEAIGRKNFRGFMQIVHELLTDGGLWLLHTIGSDVRATDPWLNRYIFPNGELPCLKSLNRSMGKLFSMLDFHDISENYAPTLEAWRVNFINCWDKIHVADPDRFDHRFYRMWIYYLTSCRGSFLANNIQTWHLVLRKGRGNNKYQPVR